MDKQLDLFKVEFRAGRDLYYIYTRIYHTVTDLRFWLAVAVCSLWYAMVGV